MAGHRLVERAEWDPLYRGGWPWYAGGKPHRPLPATEAWAHYPGGGNIPPEGATFEQDREFVIFLDRVGYVRFGPSTGTGWGVDEAGLYGAGISYSLVITKAGRIFRGHDPGRQSSHTAGHNVTGMGYCFLVADGEDLTDAQVEAAAWALTEQVRLGELAAPRLDGGHRDVYPTICPTEKVMAAIPRINALAGGTPVSKPAPTRQQLKDLCLEWKALGGEWYCTPWDWEAGICRPGNHGHSADSMHFKGLAFDKGWPGPAIHDLEALAVIAFQRYVDRTKPYDVRWRFNVSATDHPDHMHGDAGQYNGPGWYDDVRDRRGVLARDGVDLFLPTTFTWHVPPINLDFTIGDIAAWQSKMRRLIRPSTGKPYYSGRVDGYHGDGSKRGTRDFQTDNGLTPDAKPGSATNKAADRLLAASEKSIDQQRYDAIVKMLTDAGQDVAAYITRVQKMLLAAGYDPKGVDGSPGSGFQAALGRFQKDHKLKVDYLPGRETWDALVAATTTKAPDPIVPPVIKPTPAPAPVPGRLAGADRYHTAALVARQARPERVPGKVYLAAGWSDAAAAAAAGDGLVLLARSGSDLLPGTTASALRDLAVTELVIVGGTTAIPEPQARQAADAANRK